MCRSFRQSRIEPLHLKPPTRQSRPRSSPALTCARASKRGERYSRQSSPPPAVLTARGKQVVVSPRISLASESQIKQSWTHQSPGLAATKDMPPPPFRASASIKVARRLDGETQHLFPIAFELFAWYYYCIRNRMICEKGAIRIRKRAAMTQKRGSSSRHAVQPVADWCFGDHIRREVSLTRSNAPISWFAHPERRSTNAQHTNNKQHKTAQPSLRSQCEGRSHQPGKHLCLSRLFPRADPRIATPALS